MIRRHNGNRHNDVGCRIRHCHWNGVPYYFVVVLLLFTLQYYHSHHVPIRMLVAVATATTTTPASTFLQYKCGSHATTALPATTSIGDTTVQVEPTIWVYTGSLMDPYTGQQICNVQGIEYIQPIAQVTIGEDDNDNHPDQTKSTPTGWFQEPYRRRCRPLQITSVLDDYFRQPQPQQDHSTITHHHHHHDAPPDSIQCHTVWSRKLFCYTPPTTIATTTATHHPPKEHHHSIANDTTATLSNLLFTSFRRPGLGPTQSIPVDQAILCYDSIISSISGRRRRRRLVPSPTTTAASNHSTNDDPSFVSIRPWWILHTEIPTTGHAATNPNRSSRDTSKCIWSCIDQHPSSSSLSSGPQQFDFSIFTRRRSVPLSLTSVIADVSMTNTNHPPNHSKRRRPWLQIGSSSSSTSRDPSGSAGGGRKNELGVRETYQYYRSTTTTGRTAPLGNDDLTLRYTRYGEAPVWYGPGRVCVLDLTGTRIQPLSSNDRDDSYVEDRVIDTVRQYVPVISSILLKFVPDFWNVLPSQRTRTSTNNQQSTPRQKQNDKHFMYYADALHPALQSTKGEDVEGNDECHRRISLATADEYRQYYNDLAMGRQLRQLLTPTSTARLSAPQQLLQRMEYEHRRNMSQNAQRCQQVTNAIQNTVGTVWDKLRTASTLSIW